MKTGVLTPVKYKEMQLNAMKTTQKYIFLYAAKN